MNSYSLVVISDYAAFKEEIRSLWKRSGSYMSEERFAWLYQDNPVGPTLTVLARAEDTDKVVGCSSLYPWPFRINGRDVKVGISVDVGLDPKHRAYGPGVAIQRKILSSLCVRDFEIAFIYPYSISYHLFQRAGYEHIGHAYCWVRLLKYEDKLVDFVKLRSIARATDFVARKLGLLLEWLLVPTGRRDFVTRTLSSCDDRFNALWESQKQDYQVIPHQTADYLNWRYSSCPTIDYEYFCLFDKKDEATLKGFIVYCIRGDRVIVKDVFPPKSPDLLSLLTEFVSQMKRRNVKSVEVSYFGSASFERTLGKALFVRRKARCDYLAYCRDDTPSAHRKLLLNKDCYLFFG
jgi:hypothetical protein